MRVERFQSSEGRPLDVRNAVCMRTAFCDAQGVVMVSGFSGRLYNIVHAAEFLGALETSDREE